MAVKILDSRDAGGGHKSFDFVLDTTAGEIKKSQIFEEAAKIEKEIFGTESAKSFAVNDKRPTKINP